MATAEYFQPSVVPIREQSYESRTPSTNNLGQEIIEARESLRVASTRQAEFLGELARGAHSPILPRHITRRLRRPPFRPYVDFKILFSSDVTIHRTEWKFFGLIKLSDRLTQGNHELICHCFKSRWAVEAIVCQVRRADEAALSDHDIEHIIEVLTRSGLKPLPPLRFFGRGNVTGKHALVPLNKYLEPDYVW